MTSVLFVCLGNICRSPTAEGVFRHQLEAAGLATQVQVDSAGTGHWHIGEPPDERARAAARLRGYDLEHLRARQVNTADFQEFDYILAMDRKNLTHLQALAPSSYAGTLKLMLDYLQSPNYTDVPDPYYGSGDGFNLVLDLIEQSSRSLLAEIQARSLSS